MLPSVLSAQSTTDTLNSGTTWLLSARYDMGMWVFKTAPDPLQTEFTADDFTPTYVRDTLEAVKTLQTLNTAVSEYEATLNWIEFSALPSTQQLSQKIQILSKAGNDVTSIVSEILTYKNSDNGFGGAKGYPSNAMDTAFALQALAAIQYNNSTVINNALNFIISAQNSDGGFGLYKSKSSNTYMTALVSSTLQQFQQTTSIATAVNKATSYLMSHQNIDGGFATSTGSVSTVYETALSIIALIGSGQGDPSTGSGLPIQNAINYLISNQQLNGSWNDDPYSTALAIRALASVKPNLSITSSDISFSKSMPLIGEEITITATVKNTGIEDASNVIVRFYQGDPNAGGVQIGSDQAMSLIAHGASAQTAITTSFISTGSKKGLGIK